MLLYFSNDSKQKKILMDTDFVEDVYDEVVLFFEDYNIRPHFIEIKRIDEGCYIGWNSTSERFICESITDTEIDELRALFES